MNNSGLGDDNGRVASYPKPKLGRRLGPSILLSPGIGLKRWLVTILFGFALFSMGVGFLMAISISPVILPLLRTVTFSGFPPVVRGVIFLSVGILIVVFGTVRAYRWVVRGTQQRFEPPDILRIADMRLRLERGPKIVAIGGGTGLSTLLRGLKQETANLTAIVTISDDGGSSGKLRKDLNMPPPGDARNCLIALAQDDTLLEELFDYRFYADKNSFLDGHSLGNLLLAALYDKQGGLQEGLAAAAQLLSVSGTVVPVSNKDFVLKGQTKIGTILEGESAIGHAIDPLVNVWVEPDMISANVAALDAISEADIIVIGPGSLYTSIIPNFLVKEFSQCVAASKAPKIYVCNVATQPHETDNYDVADHILTFQKHAGMNATHLLLNTNVEALPPEWNQIAIEPYNSIDQFNGEIIMADVVDEVLRTRHDPVKLAKTVVGVRY